MLIILTHDYSLLNCPYWQTKFITLADKNLGSWKIISIYFHILFNP